MKKSVLHSKIHKIDVLTRGIIKAVLLVLVGCLLFGAAFIGADAALLADVRYLTLSPGSDSAKVNFSWHSAGRADNDVPCVRVWAGGGAQTVFYGIGSGAKSSVSNMYYNRVTVLVSTIHQTKGREFDNVFLALCRFSRMDDETRREIYVAITRAKQNLYIFCNGDFFDRIEAENVTRTSDNNDYPTPPLISLQLFHEDVALSYFTNRRKEIDTLISGHKLSLGKDGCYSGNKQVLKFSAKFAAKIGELGAKGYSPSKAVVRHIVFWPDKDNNREVKIILPDIEFSMNSQIILR